MTSQAAPNLRLGNMVKSGACFHSFPTVRRRGMREKTRERKARLGRGWNSSHSFCLASPLLASSMENEDACAWISFHGKIQSPGWRNSGRFDTFDSVAGSVYLFAQLVAMRRSAGAPPQPVWVKGSLDKWMALASAHWLGACRAESVEQVPFFLLLSMDTWRSWSRVRETVTEIASVAQW